MEASEAKEVVGRLPFNMGIKELKRVLSRLDMTKGQRSEAVKLYKERLYTRVDEVRTRMENELLPDKDITDATDK